MTTPRVPSRKIVSLRVDATSYAHATEQVCAWAGENTARSVCATTVHVVMEAHDSDEFAAIMNSADLVTPDGVPLVWALRMLGIPHATRVYGPDLTLHVCKAAAESNIPVGLYGSTPESLAGFTAFLKSSYPGINIACSISPPFREPTVEEDEQHVREILNSGARILLVGLGCPKQERWIAGHRNRLPLVMMAVGVAFDFHAGSLRQAPRWVMRMGLEWLFRLAVEPRRLWKRYFKHNPRFVWYFLKQWLRTNRKPKIQSAKSEM
jgi:N-acetylglucosaminyldiphosphoundecaprenol N-acetyl-beta-D-mannosaminyltransferase